jgi:hypothetical protein
MEQMKTREEILQTWQRIARFLTWPERRGTLSDQEEHTVIGINSALGWVLGRDELVSQMLKRIDAKLRENGYNPYTGKRTFAVMKGGKVN